jgi:hypothetical protein
MMKFEIHVAQKRGWGPTVANLKKLRAVLHMEGSKTARLEEASVLDNSSI